MVQESTRKSTRSSIVWMAWVAALLLPLAARAAASRPSISGMENSRSRRTSGSWSRRMGRRSSTWATRRGSCSTGSIARRRTVPGEPGGQGIHGDPGGGDRRGGRPRRPESLRPSAADRSGPGPAGREGRPEQRLLGPRRLHREQGQLAGPVHRLSADLGPVLARQGEGRQAAVHRAECRDVRPVARPALQGQATDLDPRRRPPHRERRAEGGHPRHGPRPAQGRRRRAPDDVPSAAAARAPRSEFHNDDWLDFNMRQNGHMRRVHRPIREHAGGLRPHAGQAGDRRRADLRGPPGLVRRQEARPLDLRPTSAGRCTGTCSAAPAATPTAITRSGRCGSPAAARSTTR